MSEAESEEIALNDLTEQGIDDIEA